jgi:hypothetical protein
MRHLRESRWTRLRGRMWYIPAGGHGKTTQCVLCHGPDLRGLGGVLAAPMAEAVAKLDADDLILLAAYTAVPRTLVASAQAFRNLLSTAPLDCCHPILLGIGFCRLHCTHRWAAACAEQTLRRLKHKRSV